MAPHAHLTTARWLGALALCAAALLVAVAAGLSFGSSEIGGLPLLGRLLGGELSPGDEVILWQARLPRVIFATLVGAALATAGAVFQAVLRNPLADPYILGVSGGAALGGTVVLALGAGAAAAGSAVAFGVPVGAFAGALLAIVLILSVARWTPGGRTGTYVLLLTGVIFNAFASACIMFLKSVVTAEKAQELLFYLMGSLDVEGVGAAETALVAAAVLLPLAALAFFVRDLDVLTLGDDEAASLGVSVASTRWWTVLLASVAVSISVAYTGLIGFVGLVVPHGLRLWLGPDHRLLLPACALGGAAFLTLSDVLARSAFGLFSTALPVGVVTAFVGAPLFVFFLHRSLTRGAEPSVGQAGP